MFAMPSSTIDELFRKTLEGEYDDDVPWGAVRELRRLGTREVFDKAAQWCQSADPLQRTRGLDIIAQIGKTADHPRNRFPQESFSLVSRLVCSEKDIRPLGSAIAALGHIDDERAVALVARFKQHPSAKIRFDVAFALGSYPNHPLSVEILLELMGDEDEEVRDWGTFGVGVLGDTDSPEVREVLARALDDTYEEVREEALVGIAKRRDLRALPPLLEALEREFVTMRIIDAACALLEFEDEPKDWMSQDYAGALREKFADKFGERSC
jgi:HEAT repeat protein